MTQIQETYIMGAGKFGNFVYQQLAKYKKDWHILGYIDSDIHKKGMIKGEQEVLYLFDPEIKNADKGIIIFIAITDNKTKQKVAYQLGHYGFHNVYEVLNEAFFNDRVFVTFSDLDERYVKRYKTTADNIIKPVLPYLETHIVNGCNLKCKGCSHFSNLYSTNAVVDFGQYEKDMVRMGELSDIICLRLLGGEPLLNANILQYLKIARQVFPDTDIYVATNGTLIPSCKDEVLLYMAENNITFSITLYKTVIPMKNSIVSRLESFGVPYNLHKNIGTFEKMLTLNGDKDPKRNIGICSRKICLTLKDGKLYRCAISAHLSKYNEIFQTAIESEALFDIYTDTLTRLWELSLEYPDKEVATCRYCVNPPIAFPWEPSRNPVKEEWLV